MGIHLVESNELATEALKLGSNVGTRRATETPSGWAWDLEKAGCRALRGDKNTLLYAHRCRAHLQSTAGWKG